MTATHEVFNQPEPLAGSDLFEGNRPLRDALKFNAPRLDTAELSRLGALLGSAEMPTNARVANVHPPQLPRPDRFGRRIDQVEFHPSYHVLMKAATGAGLHGTPWASLPPPSGEGWVRALACRPTHWKGRKRPPPSLPPKGEEQVRPRTPAASSSGSAAGPPH